MREASGATAYSFGFATVLLMRAGYVGWPSDLGLQQQLMSRSRAARSLSMRVVALVSIVVALVTISAIAVLVWPAPVFPLIDTASKLEALKTALAIGAGAAGIATLLLAASKQVHHEKTSLANELDATERRITDLYSKSVDQLGSDRSAVRLGGLYALERLAQDNPRQRQPVVNVLCSYLRMPYLAPLPVVRTDESSTEASGTPESSSWQVAPGAIDTWVALAELVTSETDASLREALSDWHVRIAAQRILSLHLRHEPQQVTGADGVAIYRDADVATGESFWSGMSVDLTGAALYDFNFRNCVVRHGVFRACRFFGVARFYGAVFEPPAEFDGTRFHGAVWFEAANFANDAWFGGAQFHVTANFRKAHFGRRASFGSDGRLGPARFYQSVDFADAVFSRPPELAGALVRPQAPSDLRRVWPPEWCPRSPDDAESEWQELAVFGPPL